MLLPTLAQVTDAEHPRVLVEEREAEHTLMVLVEVVGKRLLLCFRLVR